MSKTVFHTAATLNGFLADDDDSLEWLFAVPGGDDTGLDFAEFFPSIGALVMGSVTYEWVLRHDESAWARTYGALPCFVVTHRDLPLPDGGDVRFVSGPVDDWWADLAAAAGSRPIWLVGGGDLVGQFDDAGRLDEVRVSIAPAVLPSGKPLLPRRIGPDRLRLTSARQVGQFAELAYEVRPARG